MSSDNACIGAPLRVVKVGGSLLDEARLGPWLRTWLAAGPPAPTMLVAGGGQLVDRLREADRTHGIGEERSHELAIRAMSLTARLLAAILPEAELTSAWPPASEFPASGLLVLDTAVFLLGHEPWLPDPLPHTWEVTSDSIAARLACVLGADELVLLKSALPTATDRRGAAAAGYVDPYFPQASAPLRLVRCVNLRAAGFPEARL